MNQRSSTVLELYHIVNFLELVTQCNHIDMLYQPQICALASIRTSTKVVIFCIKYELNSKYKGLIHLYHQIQPTTWMHNQPNLMP